MSTDKRNAKAFEFLGFWREAGEARRGRYGDHARSIMRRWAHLFRD